MYVYTHIHAHAHAHAHAHIQNHARAQCIHTEWLERTHSHLIYKS